MTSHLVMIDHKILRLEYSLLIMLYIFELLKYFIYRVWNHVCEYGDLLLVVWKLVSMKKGIGFVASMGF